jgi:hypothetical protein
MKCVACGKPITYRFCVCAECEDKYGKYASDQPEWLRFLVKNTKNTRQRFPVISLDFVDMIIDQWGDTASNALVSQIYDVNARPTEEEALDHVKRRGGH